MNGVAANEILFCCSRTNSPQMLCAGGCTSSLASESLSNEPAAAAATTMAPNANYLSTKTRKGNDPNDKDGKVTKEEEESARDNGAVRNERPKATE